MKKNLLLSGAVALSFLANAQFETTDYKGAFAPAPTPMWTEGWAEWNPGDKLYPATTAELSADVTANMTLTSDKVWLLKNKVYVTNGATLTIEAGTVIRGDKDTEAALIITRGSKIYAVGTASAPIVFTSNFAEGDRFPGDWGGVIILGNAVTNQAAPIIEGGLDATKASYGGTNNEDSSGVFKYVRIEFGGFPFQPDQEINGLTMGGVGNKTVIEYVQSSFTNDDSFEWFGGSVNAKHLVAYRGTDDDFDTDFGFSGHVQFGLGVRDPEYSDQCTCSSSEGFESDNDPSGTDGNPRTSAQFKNMTIIGPLRGDVTATVNAKFVRAARIRRNSQISITQSVFMDWPQGVVFDGTKSEVNARNGVLSFTDNIVAGVKTKPYGITSAFGSTTFADQAALDTWFTAGNNKYLATTANVLTAPYSWTAPDFRPGDELLTGLTVAEMVDVQGIAMFPNPAVNNVEIALNKNFSNAVVTIQNSIGAVVATGSATDAYAKFDVSHLNNGLYIVSVREGNKSVSKTLLVNR